MLTRCTRNPGRLIFVAGRSDSASLRLQWLANELARISMKLSSHVAVTSPKAQMDTRRVAGEEHQARALVFANGVHRGFFVIERIDEAQQQLADDGSYIAISARV